MLPHKQWDAMRITKEKDRKEVFHLEQPFSERLEELVKKTRWNLRTVLMGGGGSRELKRVQFVGGGSIEIKKKRRR